VVWWWGGCGVAVVGLVVMVTVLVVVVLEAAVVVVGVVAVVLAAEAAVVMVLGFVVAMGVMLVVVVAAAVASGEGLGCIKCLDKPWYYIYSLVLTFPFGCGFHTITGTFSAGGRCCGAVSIYTWIFLLVFSGTCMVCAVVFGA